MNHPTKLRVAVGTAAVTVLFSYIGYSALRTFQDLRLVEADRDQWQRPSDVIQSLDLKPGDVAVDLGCGSGYFALKLSPIAGRGGRIVAEDIRTLPLIFLWARAAARHDRNINIVLGATDDPHLPPHVNAVLISNTYHEFADPHAILAHVYSSLVSGGRLVVTDREPKLPKAATTDATDHEISVEIVEADLRRMNFRILAEQDNFVPLDSYGETWWLISAEKP